MWSLMCLNQEGNDIATAIYINNYKYLTLCYSVVSIIVLYFLLSLGLFASVQAQPLSESVHNTKIQKFQSQADCHAEQSLIEIKNKDYGTVLWVDGIRYGFIPIQPFCIPFGLHLFELYKTSSGELNWKLNKVQRYPIWSQVIWVPNKDQLKLEISHLGTSSQSKNRVGRRLHNQSTNLENRSGASSKQSKQDFNHFKLANETIITAKPESVHQQHFNKQKLINRQSILYHHSPHDQLNLYVDIQGLRDLFEPSPKVHTQDPITQKFELWVQELHISFGWRSWGGQPSQKNTRVNDQITYQKTDLQTKELEKGLVKVGRFIRQTGARVRRLDGLELFQPLSTFTGSKGTQRNHRLGLSLTLAQNRVQNLAEPKEFTPESASTSNILITPTYRNLWIELGLSYRQIFHDIDSEFKNLKFKLSAIYLDQKTWNSERVTSSNHASNSVDTNNLLGLFDVEWRHDEQQLKSHLAYNTQGQLSHSYQEIIIPKSMINIGLKARWQYFVGDQWDQQWLDSSVWPNTYQSPMLNFNQGLYWQGLSLAYGYQKGQPSWYQSSHQIGGIRQALSFAWGPLGSALIKLPKEDFLNQRFTQLAQQRKSEKNGVQPDQKKTQNDFIYQVEALLVKELNQDPSQYLNQDQLTQANQNTDNHSVKIASLRTSLLLSGSGAFTKRYRKHEFSLESRLSYAIDTHEWWPELSLGWQYEQVKLSTECAKPLVSPQTIDINRWLAYCGLLIDIEAWVRR